MTNITPEERVRATIKIRQSPAYLETDLIDEDIKKVFKEKGGYFSYEPLLAQLIKELKIKNGT